MQHYSRCMMDVLNKSKRTFIILIITNLMPLILLFSGKGISQVLMLYWFETAVFGILTLVKMVHRIIQSNKSRKSSIVFDILMLAVFILHFGITIIGMLTFLIALSALQIHPLENALALEGLPEVFNVQRNEDILPTITGTVFSNFSAGIFSGIWIGCLVLFLQYVYLYYESQKTRDIMSDSPGKLMFSPYKRVVVIYGILFLGMFLVSINMNPYLLLVILGLPKAAFDIFMIKNNS